MGLIYIILKIVGFLTVIYGAYFMFTKGEYEAVLLGIFLFGVGHIGRKSIKSRRY